MRSLSATLQGKTPGPEASIQKIMADEHGQHVMTLAKDLAGAEGMLTGSGPRGQLPASAQSGPTENNLAVSRTFPDVDPIWHYGYLFHPALTLGRRHVRGAAQHRRRVRPRPPPRAQPRTGSDLGRDARHAERRARDGACRPHASRSAERYGLRRDRRHTTRRRTPRRPPGLRDRHRWFRDEGRGRRPGHRRPPDSRVPHPDAATGDTGGDGRGRATISSNTMRGPARSAWRSRPWSATAWSTRRRTSTSRGWESMPTRSSAPRADSTWRWSTTPTPQASRRCTSGPARGSPAWCSCSRSAPGSGRACSSTGCSFPTPNSVTWNSTVTMPSRTAAASVRDRERLELEGLGRACAALPPSRREAVLARPVHRRWRGDRRRHDKWLPHVDIETEIVPARHAEQRRHRRRRPDGPSRQRLNVRPIGASRTLSMFCVSDNVEMRCLC